ncbi:MAG: methylcrotonoyl-CoA carboxylase [Ardenticatenaceae bacterium]|nr:methylcrotonoyl-CoA carboxylase [Ardenticatenaceae bacterium]MCB8974389.1 methylcrotonoyl-CoA carboxylase [Ardenticatenaceae bacterium]
MDKLKSSLNTRSEEYKTNRAAMLELVQTLEARQTQVRLGGGERGMRKFRQEGKLLPRERLELLLDPGTPFLELSPLAAWGMYNDEAPAALQIVGIGVVGGVECLVSVNDATAKGGAVYPMSLQKTLRAQTIAAENRLPCITCVESAGANLLYQDEIFNLGGRTFANQARLSAAGIPQVALVFGSSTAGGAYVPGMSDYTVFVRGKATAYLGGPPLVKMAIGEEVDDETLGGAEMHAQVSGLSDYLAEDDVDAVRIGRFIASQLHQQKPPACLSRRQSPRDPAYDPDELLGVIPADPRVPFDIREVIARLVDGSEFFEFKPEYGPTLVTGHAVLNGWPVGILGNNGILFSECANKAAQFIQLCNQSRTPLIYLQNITGFMVGTQYERGGIIKHGSQMINAVATSSVPQFSVIVGGSYGAGNYAMCGRSYDPRFLWSWPNSRVAVMGGEQAAGVLGIVQESAARRRGIEPDKTTIEAMQMMTRQKFEQESDPYYATARLWDDGILDPRDTRRALSVGLSVAHNVDFVTPGQPHYGVFRM